MPREGDASLGNASNDSEQLHEVREAALRVGRLSGSCAVS